MGEGRLAHQPHGHDSPGDGDLASLGGPQLAVDALEFALFLSAGPAPVFLYDPCQGMSPVKPSRIGRVTHLDDLGKVLPALLYLIVVRFEQVISPVDYGH